MKRWAITLAVVLWLFVGFVECYDIYWSIKLADTLYQNELNPIGKLLIQLDDGNVAFFMTLKIMIMGLVLTTIPLLFKVKQKVLAWTILLLAALSRLGVLIFLEAGHHWVG